MLLFVSLNYSFSGKSPKDKELELRYRKKCQKNNNRKLKRFCKKCLFLDIENPKILEINKFYEKENFSFILLSNSNKV